jgi:hypothetical protein
VNDNTDILNHTESAEKQTNVGPTQKEVREAILRLRKLGESLSPIDAVAVIRKREGLNKVMHGGNENLQ